MGVVRIFTARSLDWAMKSVGSKGLDIARDIVPLPIKRHLSRFLSREVKLSEEIVTSKSGHKFVAIKEPVFLQVRYQGTYEKELSIITRQLISKDDTVVDAGANFGWYSILMASCVGETGQVYSYEPNSAISPVLKKNIELNNYSDRISLTKCGLGENEEFAFLAADDTESAIGYIDKNQATTLSDSSENGVQIRVLDKLMAKKIGGISFIKIDVEGFEPFVLRGAKKVFSSKNPPAMLMEFNIEALERQDVDVNQFIEELMSLDAQLLKVAKGKLVEMESIPKINENIFFLPKKGKYQRSIESLKL